MDNYITTIFAEALSEVTAGVLYQPYPLYFCTNYLPVNTHLMLDYSIESHLDLQRGSCRGSIEVICGSMFSGKTEELMRRIRRALIARLRVEVFKPDVDTRYSQDDIVSHDQNAYSCTAVDHSLNILLLATDANVIGIDEAQFFDPGIVEVCQKLADDGKRIIISGLDMDYQRRPFSPMPELIAIADSVTKVHAVCVDCGACANYSYRLADEKARVLLGAKGEYAPLCRKCYLRRIQPH